jgi:hypothetical protein
MPAQRVNSFVLLRHYIWCRDDRVPNKIGYFDLESGAVRGEPGGLRAVFAEWELALSDDANVYYAAWPLIFAEPYPLV